MLLLHISTSFTRLYLLFFFQQLAIGFAFAGGKVEESARKLEHLIRTAVEVIRHNRNKEFLDKSDPLTYEMDCQWRSKMEALCQSNCNIESGVSLCSSPLGSVMFLCLKFQKWCISGIRKIDNLL